MGQALANALADLLREVIPDIRGQLGWYDSNCIHLFSDALEWRTDHNHSIVGDPDYKYLGDLIREAAEKAGVEMPLLSTPGIYLMAEEQERIREILRRAFVER